MCGWRVIISIPLGDDGGWVGFGRPSGLERSGDALAIRKRGHSSKAGGSDRGELAFSTGISRKLCQTVERVEEGGWLVA